jgi:hypothetical protein
MFGKFCRLLLMAHSFFTQTTNSLHHLVSSSTQQNLYHHGLCSGDTVAVHIHFPSTDNRPSHTAYNNGSQIEEPTSPTTAPVPNQLELHIPKTHMSQKQMALTNFYTVRPLHIIETHPSVNVSSYLSSLDCSLLSY